MRARLMLILILLAALALAGCVCKKPVVMWEPVEVQSVVRVVAPIPPSLLELHPDAEAPGSDLHRCPEIAQQRLAEIRVCNADKRAIRSMGEKGETR